MSLVKLLSLAFFLFTGSLSFACIVRDDAGNLVYLPRPAERIITLSPDLAELAFALHAGQSVVGVIEGSTYPAAAQKIPRVGDYQSLDFERILVLHPDLILAWGESHGRQIESLKRLSIPVFISHTHHLREIPYTLRRLACLMGKEKEASLLAEHFLVHYQRIKQKYHKSFPIRVFYQLASHPLITLNQTSWISEAIALCGGRNIFASTGLTTPFKQTAFAVSREAVVERDPELIIADLPFNWQESWLAWPSVSAVKNHHLVSLPPDLLERPGPRILEGVEELCRIMHNPCYNKALARKSVG
ncbi:MAG TPA: cobalamin-binding protein [Gammaproteobacteria bacterium]|nr:cobalamin-binding protein [Gammaproteobacteria bacterium]